MTRTLIASFICAASVCASSVSFAQIVFQDDFNAENGGVGTVNYAAFANWTVSDGSVDLIGNGFFDFFPGNGLYVDLDGATANAGVLTSAPIAVSPGSYQLQFNLGCGCGFGNDSMLVTLGGDFSETFDATDAGASPNFNVITRPIQVTSAGSVSLVFDHAGGDNFGLVIDNVSLTRLVPEPASFVLLSLSAIGLLARRR
jgi:hypothetical protein